MSIFTKNKSLSKLFTKYHKSLAKEEGLSSEFIRDSIRNGTMVLLANPAHNKVKPMLIGQPARVKINANIGTSPLSSCHASELKKMKVAVKAGADTIMDLSIAGDLQKIRLDILNKCHLPLGTVPLYSVAQPILNANLKISTLKKEDIFAEIQRQAEQGVDFMTVHCGVSKRIAELGANKKRIMGIVSRGGSLLARWMRDNKTENPLLSEFERLVDIAIKHNITLSLGDGLRPGAGIDAGDAAQWEEVILLGELAEYALSKGVQCMIEGPGHVPLHEVKTQIQSIKKLTNNAPLYVLGPLTIDTAAGYDHIAGAIGGAIAVQAGVDFLCYITPAEHLTLPNEADVYVGVMASRVAAQAGEVALNNARAVKRELDMNTARKKLDWVKMAKATLDPRIMRMRREEHKTEDVCAMCGNFCAVKMLNEEKE